jgi:hypothetical protein
VPAFFTRVVPVDAVLRLSLRLVVVVIVEEEEGVGTSSDFSSINFLVK